MSNLSHARHEPRDVSVPGLLISAGGLVVAVVFAFLVSWWAFDYFSARGRVGKPSAFPLAAQERGRLPPEPRLEEIDRLEGKKVGVHPTESHAEQQRQIETYGWVDEKAGVVRIPVSRAMSIIVDNNLLPARPDEERDRIPERETRRPGSANSGRTIGGEQ